LHDLLATHASGLTVPAADDRPDSLKIDRVERAALLVLLVASLVLTAHFLTSSFERVLGTFEDDSFYYLTIARRIAAGEGSTFDGIHFTNGYHPLWCAFLVPLMSAFHGHPEMTVRAVAVVSVWLRFASSVLLLRLAVRAFTDRIAGALTAVAFFAVANGFSTNGMEEPLQMLALMALLTVAARDESMSLAEHGARGLLVALVILARLDMIFVAVAYFAYAFFTDAQHDWRAALRARAAEAIPCGLVIAAYLGWNATHFDTIVPISGMLKNSSVPHLSLSPTYWTEASAGRRVLMLHAAATAVFLTLAGKFDATSRLTGWIDRRAIAAFRVWLLGTMGFVAYELLFGKWGNWFSWYYQPLAFVGAIGLGQWLQSVGCWLRTRGIGRQHAHRLLVAGAAAMTIFLGVSLALRQYGAGQDFQVASYRAGTWVAANTPEDTILAMKDSGSFGFFSNRRVISLDGVTNNLAYQRALIERGISRYLEDEGVTLIAQHSLRRSSQSERSGHYETLAIEYRSNLFERSGGTLTLARADEVFRLPWVSADYGPNVFVIWRVRNHQ